MDYGGAMNQVKTVRARGGCAGEDGSLRPRRFGTGHKRRVPMGRNADDASQIEPRVPKWSGRSANAKSSQNHVRGARGGPAGDPEMPVLRNRTQANFSACPIRSSHVCFEP